METKFTKGEWCIFGDWGIIKNGWETEVIATFEPRGAGQKESFANAHLIKTSPKMYEMLESLRENYGANDPTGIEIDELLADARGEQHA